MVESLARVDSGGRRHGLGQCAGMPPRSCNRLESRGVDPTPREEMDTLLDVLLRFARQMLDKHGEFYPFAAAVSSRGEIEMVASDLGEEHPDSSVLIESLYEGLAGQAAADEIRAAGVCADVRVTAPESSDKTDAISVAIEHVTGDPVEVFLPYTKGRLRGVQYGELFAQSGVGRVFPP
jgi:hypothetical protein